MKKVIKNMILDFHQSEPRSIISRSDNLPVLPSTIRKAIVLIGMRRVGKTYLLYQHMQHRVDAGLDKRKILYLNFEDDRLIAMKAEQFQDILDAYFELYPEFSHVADLEFYFDEIHNIESWELFVRRLLDKEKMQLYITGSSAKLLSKEIATSLRGRCISREVFPLSVREYLIYHDMKNLASLSTKEQNLLHHHIENYLKEGGFPEILLTEQGIHREIIQDYVNTAVYRDVIERHKIKNAHLVRLFLNCCLQNIATNLSINKVYNSFKSNGSVIGKNSLYEIFDHFTDAYLLYAVQNFNYSTRQRQVNSPKIYTTDPGIIYAFSIKPDTERASAFENTVFLAIRCLTEDIFFYKTATYKEVDFVLRDANGRLILVQACIDISDNKTVQRESRALVEASAELGKCKLMIVTPHGGDNLNDLSIDVRALWQFSDQLESLLY